MILILGRKDDYSSYNVAEWLHFFGVNYRIFNTDSSEPLFIESYNPQAHELIIKQGCTMINLYDVKAVWNRRHGFNAKSLTDQYISRNSIFFPEKKRKTHYTQTFEESKSILEFIHYFIEKNSIVSIGSYFSNDVNKLIVLDKAMNVGFDIPKTYLLSRKNLLFKIVNTEENIITKPCTQGIYVPYLSTKYQYYNYVNRLSIDFIKNLPDTFYPSLFQYEEKKDYELRVFYLYGECYSMAIFSQDNEMAKIDFRMNQDWIRPLKHVPYNLPVFVKKKIKILMNLLKLNTGSLDFIVNTKGEYIFLEVNPCGQFNMTSIPCNYYLEKKIAQKLIKSL